MWGRRLTESAGDEFQRDIDARKPLLMTSRGAGVNRTLPIRARTRDPRPARRANRTLDFARAIHGVLHIRRSRCRQVDLEAVIRAARSHSIGLYTPGDHGQRTTVLHHAYLRGKLWQTSRGFIPIQ